MIEADEDLVKTANRIIKSSSNSNNHGLQIQKFVTIDNIDEIKAVTQFLNPDFMSLDIDSMDYYVAEKIFDCGFKPKIFVVEYNSVFGLDNPITIKFDKEFIFGKDDPNFLLLWGGIVLETPFPKHNYEFISEKKKDPSGVNAFFVDPNCFDPIFLKNLKNNFAENQLQYEKFR